MAHAGLGRQVDHALGPGVLKQLGHARAVGHVELHEAEAVKAGQLLQACGLERYVLVVVEVVQANDPVAPLQQAQAGVHADEASGTGDEPGDGLAQRLRRLRRQGAHRRASAVPAGSRPLTSYNTAPGWPKAMRPLAPSARNSTWATASTMAL